MTGFIYLQARAGFTPPALEQFCPADGRVCWSRTDAAPSEWLWGWGAKSGDVRLVHGDSGEFVVLSGYLAEIGGKRFSDQARAAQVLLEKVRATPDLNKVGEMTSTLIGSWAFLYRHSNQDRTVVGTDRMASRCLWSYDGKKGLALSSHPVSISAALDLKEWDLAALAAVLLYGGPVNPCRSVFPGVLRVPPGSVCRFSQKAKTETHRWYRFRHRPNLDLSEAEWVKIAADRLTTAAARILAVEEEPVVFFSGGVDSRLAASALVAAGGKPLLLTLGDAANIEVRVARRAAQALRLSQQVLLRDRLWYLRRVNQAVFQSGGSFVWTHAHFSQAAEAALLERPSSGFLLGDLCEAFSKLFCARPPQTRNPWLAADFIAEFDSLRLPDYQPANPSASLGMLQADARGQAARSLKVDVATQFEAVREGVDDPLIVVDQCLRWQNIATLPTYFMFLDLRAAASERNIMFDPGVHELLELLPSKIRHGANLGAKIIAQLAPRAAWVVNSNTLLPLRFPPLAHRASKRVKPILGGVRRWLLRNPYTTTGSWPSRRIRYMNDPDWRSFIARTLEAADQLDSSIFNRDAIRTAGRELLAGNPERVDDVERAVLLVEVSRMLNRGVSAYLLETTDTPRQPEASAVAQCA